MAAHNMKTAFCLPSGVNEEFPSNLMWQQHQQQHQKKKSTNNKITNSHQNSIRNVHRNRPVLKSLFNKVSGLQPGALLKKTLTQVSFCEIIKNTFFYQTPQDNWFWKSTRFY